MHPYKLAFTIALSLFSILNYGQHTDQINSNRPGETMSAYAVGKKVIQIESGVFGITENHSLLNYDANGFGVDLTARYGIWKENLEIIADFQYQNETFSSRTSDFKKSDFKQTIFGAKYLIYDPFKNYKRKIDIKSWKKNRRFDLHQLIPAVSVFAGANLSFSDNQYYFSKKGAISPKFILMTQNHLGDGSWVFVTNFIADYLFTEYPSLGYGVTLTKAFTPNWSGFVENQGYKSDFYSDCIVRGGAAYLINKNMQIDASISSSVKTTPYLFYGGIGISWRNDKYHKNVIIKTDIKDPNAFDPKAKGDKKETEKEKKKKDKKAAEAIRKELKKKQG
ncbi:MAG: hypothetical protein QG594_363 [Bacteroidota bacterium]|nr:hypothetical protein [Bacteroidota bacterium]